MKKLKPLIKKYLARTGIVYKSVYYIYRLSQKVKVRVALMYNKKYSKVDVYNALQRGMGNSIEECSKLLTKSKEHQYIHVAFLITEYEEIKNTGDKYSAISLGSRLKEDQERQVLVSYYTRDPRIEWGNVGKEIDHIIVMDPETDFNIIKRKTGRKIAWVRGNYEKWLTIGQIRKYDAIIVSSHILSNKFQEIGLGRKVKGVINLGIPIDVVNQLKDTKIVYENRKKDVVFIGNIYDIERPVVKNLDITGEYSFYFYGNIQDPKHSWQPYNKGCIAHKNVTEIYLDTKIVIEDIAPFNRGTVNLRVFEAAACGALIISNYDEALQELFGDAIEMYKTKEELNNKIKYYLVHEEERIKKALQLNTLVIEKYTFKEEAEKLYHILKGLK